MSRSSAVSQPLKADSRQPDEPAGNDTSQPGFATDTGAGGQPPGRPFPPGGPGGRLANQLTENLQAGRMPLANYALLHPTAKLTTKERQPLLQGLLATLGPSAP